MTITREVREKVIQLSTEGRGRNEIARLLTGQGFHISEGTVGNIVRAYRQQPSQPVYSIIEQPSQRQQPLLQPPPPNTGINSGIPIKKTDGSSLLSGTGLAVTNSNPNVIPRHGGPLSHLLCEVDEDTTVVNSSAYSIITNTTSPAPTIMPSRNLLIKDPEVNIDPDDIIIDVNSQNETTEEEEQYHQPRSTLPNSEDTPIGIDWDSDELWDRKFLKRIMDEKRERLQQLQLLGQRMQEFQEKEQRIAQREHDLEAREAKLNEKLNEIRPLIPSVKELQNAGVTFDLIMPYVLAINEKSALEGINLKEAAYNMMQDFREYRNLMTLRRTIENAEKKLSALGKTIRQNQQAITTLMKLQAMGYTRKDIKELVALVSVWNKGSGISISNRKLDTELIDVGTQAQRNNGNDNLQQTGSINPGPGSNNINIPPPLVNENGNGGLSMNDWIRLNLLRSNTTRQLNRMGM